jgi:hypothetical protein
MTNAPTTGSLAGCCARGERPRSRAAEQGDEIASFQLIESHPMPISRD